MSSLNLHAARRVRKDLLKALHAKDYREALKFVKQLGVKRKWRLAKLEGRREARLTVLQVIGEKQRGRAASKVNKENAKFMHVYLKKG